MHRQIYNLFLKYNKLIDKKTQALTKKIKTQEKIQNMFLMFLM